MGCALSVPLAKALAPHRHLATPYGVLHAAYVLAHVLGLGTGCSHWSSSLLIPLEILGSFVSFCAAGAHLRTPTCVACLIAGWGFGTPGLMVHTNRPRRFRWVLIACLILAAHGDRVAGSLRPSVPTSPIALTLIKAMSFKVACSNIA